MKLSIKKSKKLFDYAIKRMPGGVNSPVRAFKAVGGTPIFIRRGKGALLTDEDKNTYIDLINSWGPMILGHAHPIVKKSVRKAIKNSFSFGAPTVLENKLADVIMEMLPCIEKIRMVNSGTEATMSAIRVARGYTQRKKIIKMSGCYHGHADSFLIAAGSGMATSGNPDSWGVTQGVSQDTLVVGYNNIEALQKAFEDYKDEIACVILEPVAGNMGLVLPKKGYLKSIKELCVKNQSLLIFDEVMTGFRLAKGGATEIFGVLPDIVTMGKIIGGGFPVGAYGGKKEIMDTVSPVGKVYQAGTLSGNPIALTAGIVTLSYLKKHSNSIYPKLEKIGKSIQKGIEENIKERGAEIQFERIGSMFCLFFSPKRVSNFEEAQKCNHHAFSQYFHAMLKQGVYIAPSQYESLFISTAIQKNHIEKIIEANRKALKQIKTSQ